MHPQIPDIVRQKDSNYKKLIVFLSQIVILAPELQDEVKKLIELLDIHNQSNYVEVKIEGNIRLLHRLQAALYRKYEPVVRSKEYSIIPLDERLNVLLEQSFVIILKTIKKVINQELSIMRTLEGSSQEIAEKVKENKEKIRHTIVEIINSISSSSKEEKVSFNIFYLKSFYAKLVEQYRVMELLPDVTDMTMEEKIDFMRYHLGDVQEDITEEDIHGRKRRIKELDNMYAIRVHESVREYYIKEFDRRLRQSSSKDIDLFKTFSNVNKDFTGKVLARISHAKYAVMVRKSVNVLDELMTLLGEETAQVKKVMEVLDKMNISFLSYAPVVALDNERRRVVNLILRGKAKHDVREVKMPEAQNSITEAWAGIIETIPEIYGSLISKAKEINKKDKTREYARIRDTFKHEIYQPLRIENRLEDVVLGVILLYITVNTVGRHIPAAISPVGIQLNEVYEKFTKDIVRLSENISQLYISAITGIQARYDDARVIRLNIYRVLNMLYMCRYFAVQWPIYMPFLRYSNLNVYENYTALETHTYVTPGTPDGYYDIDFIRSFSENNGEYVLFGYQEWLSVEKKKGKKAESTETERTEDKDRYNVLLDVRHTAVAIAYHLQSIFHEYNSARRLIQKHIESKIDKNEVIDIMRRVRFITDRLIFIVNMRGSYRAGLVLDPDTNLYEKIVIRDFFSTTYYGIVGDDIKKINSYYRKIHGIPDDTKYAIPEIKSNQMKQKITWYQKMFNKYEKLIFP